VFRLFQILTLLGIVPMMLLGLMSGLSGGGLTPIYQRLGVFLMVKSPIIAVVCLVVAEVFWRLDQTTLAQLVCAVPGVMWLGLLAWLQYKTGFFYRRRKQQ